MKNFIRQHSYLILDPFRYAQPVQTDKCIGDVFEAAKLKDHPRRRIQHRLESTHEICRQAYQQAIAVVQSRQNKSDHQCLERGWRYQFAYLP